MKIIEYKTATGKDIPSLDKAVNQLISEGFEPHGQQYFATWDDPSVVDTNGFFQPMAKHQDIIEKQTISTPFYKQKPN